MRSLFISAVAFLIAVPASHACSCFYGHTAEAFESSDLVFQGSVVRADGYRREPLVFSVQNVWKGDATGTVSLRHSGSSAACGLSHWGTDNTVVFARRDASGEIWSGLCSVRLAGDELTDELDRLRSNGATAEQLDAAEQAYDDYRNAFGWFGPEGYRPLGDASVD